MAKTQSQTDLLMGSLNEETNNTKTTYEMQNSTETFSEHESGTPFYEEPFEFNGKTYRREIYTRLDKEGGFRAVDKILEKDIYDNLIENGYVPLRDTPEYTNPQPQPQPNNLRIGIK